MSDTAAQAMSLGELLAQGGLTMLPIYACSIAALAVFIRKFVQLRRLRLSDLSWLEGVLAKIQAGDFDSAEAACQGSHHPAIAVVRAATRAFKERPQLAEAEARRVGSLELQELEKSLGVLSFLAQVAPLLGLLGTVIGMVDLFMTLQNAGQANVAVTDLSSGIWKALLTTAAGLAVAVPALAAHNYLASQVDKARLRLSDVIQRVLYAAPVGLGVAKTEVGKSEIRKSEVRKAHGV